MPSPQASLQNIDDSMKSNRLKRRSSQTNYVQLDTERCNACWICQDACPNNAIGRIDLPWHKHVRFIADSNCIGCLKCVKVCEFGALTRIQVIA
jgi:2-oxoglutarate ferredoxin oxidoreductase subunit delta